MNLMLYTYLTVKVTLWRKKYRTQTTKHDNEYHDRLTDSLVNYETVKYFTAEDYERSRYRNAVVKYQQASMMTQISLSFLNCGQQFVVNFSLAGGMLLATSRVIDEAHGDIGEFVAVNAYIVQIFAPLSFLGTIYNMVITAVVDMADFGKLRNETSEVQDKADAVSLGAVVVTE